MGKPWHLSTFFQGKQSCMIYMNLKVSCAWYGYEIMCVVCLCVKLAMY